MSGPALQTTGLIAERLPPTERFQSLTLFSPSDGPLRIYNRLPSSGKSPTLSLDLFDRVSVTLQPAKSGGLWFVKEVRIEHRHTGIALRLAALEEACAFASLLVRNPLHDENRQGAYDLFSRALAAWETSSQPAIVALKAWYSFGRTEGLPVREQWYAELRGSAQELAAKLLNTPLAALALDVDSHAAHALLENLKRYLRTHSVEHD